jgi:membrane protein
MNVVKLLKQTIKEFGEDKAPRLAAALAYYTAFSLAPILVIAIAVAGLVFGQEAVRAQVLEQVGMLAGAEGAGMIESMVEARQDTGTNVLAAAIGIGALLFGAGGVFLQLQDAMNTMWEVTPKPDRGFLAMIKERIFSFAMVLAVGFLLLVSLVISAALASLEGYVVGLLPEYELIMQIVSYIITFVLITLIFALIFKYVPDAVIEWRDVWLGAAVTGFLFLVGQIAISLYLGNTDFTAQFGAAGAVLVILLWVYYSAMISFFGAEFTQVYANKYGSRVQPAENALPLTREARARQGIPQREDLEEAGRSGKSAEEAGMVPLTGTEDQDEQKKLGTKTIIMKHGAFEEAPSTDMHHLPRKEMDLPQERSYKAFSALVLLVTGVTGGFVMGRLAKRKSKKVVS